MAQVSSSAQMLRIPSKVKNSIIRYSSTYDQRQVDNYYNLVQQKDAMSICQICLETSPAQDLQNISNCSHTFCQECLHNYLLYMINIGEDIKCPFVTCQEIIDTSHPAFQGLPLQFQNRCRKIRNSKADSGQSKRMCSVQNCQGTIDLEGKTPICSSCKSIFCRECHLKIHEGKSCEDGYGFNFREWRRCPSCRVFNQKGQKGNRIHCSCNLQFCYVCLGEWSDTHKNCQEEVDPLLQNVYSKNSIMHCCRCWNCFKGLLFMILLPFFLVLLFLIFLLALIASVIGGFLLGCCYSRTEGYAVWAMILCCPCLALVSVGNALKQVFMQTVKLGCAHLKKYCLTMRALCCWGGSGSSHNQSTKLEY